MFKHKLQLVVALAVFAGFAVQAAPWFSHNSRRAPKTLVVVGNYKTPRLMAETILSLTRQPYLMISSDGKYFIVMSKDSLQIPNDKLDVYINRLNPKRLVIIGDERYVTRAQEMQLRRINLKRIPIMRIYGNNWTRIAEELDDLLNIGNLARNFNHNHYDALMRDPVLRDPAEKTETPAVAAPAAMPETVPAAGGDLPMAEPSER